MHHSEWHLHDLHTLHLFISGRDKKTSPLSRSSSGFESSNLPSPESPAFPPTLTSTSPTKVLHQSKPKCQPFNLESLSLKKTYHLPSPAKGDLLHGKVNRSQSFTELKRNPAAVQLRRCCSLTSLHKKQRNNRNSCSWMKETSDYRKHTASRNLPPVTFRSSATSKEASNIDTGDMFAPQQGGKPPSTHVSLQPTGPAERFHHSMKASAWLNPRHEPVPTESPFMFNCTDHLSSDYGGSGPLSACSEARRLKMKRKMMLVKSVHLGSLTEEKTQLQDIHLQTEAESEKVQTPEPQ